MVVSGMASGVKAMVIPFEIREQPKVPFNHDLSTILTVHIYMTENKEKPNRSILNVICNSA